MTKVSSTTRALDDPRSYVTDHEIRSLYQPRPWIIARDLSFDWVLILGTITLWGSTKHWLAFIVAFVVIAARQHSLNNWVHEASHFSFTRKKRLNDWVCDIFAAAPHFISTQGYRSKHKLHHTDLGHPVKDSEIKSRFIIKGLRFWKRCIITLLGASAFFTAQTYTAQRPKNSEQASSRLRFFSLIVATNALILGWCWLWGVPFAWFYLWFLPLITLTSLLATIRVIAEHQSEDYALAGIEQFDEQLDPVITRTITTDWLTAFLLAPVKFNYHFEHHVWPGVPYTSLPVLSELLHDRGFYKANPHLYGESYYRVLGQLIRPEVTRAPKDSVHV